jgi:KipI family sensor histidine kinase inhibitor
LSKSKTGRGEIAGETSLIVYFESSSLQQNNQKVSELDRSICAENWQWLIDCVPSYQSLLVKFDPLIIDYLQVKAALQKAEQLTCKTLNESKSIHHLGAFYDHPVDNDLTRIANHHGISEEQVVAFHSAIEYQVFAIGFAPGFAFLGEVDPKIAMPRLTTPRLKVPKGAIAIADRQTAVYPNVSPGGWNIIGVCPDILFNPTISPPMPFKVGDKVKFKPLSEREFLSRGGIFE